MSQDIVSDMVKEMNLSPQAIQSLADGNDQSPQDITPEDEIQLMKNIQLQQQMQQSQMPPQMPQQDQPESQSPPTEYEYSESDDSDSVDMTTLESKDKGSGVIDNILNSLKEPIIVAIIFFVLSLPQTQEMLKTNIGKYVTLNNYHLILLLSLIAGALFYITKFLLE